MPAMTRLKYLLVFLTLVSWVTGQLFEFVPRVSEWSFFISAGFFFAALVCALSALIRRKWNALAIFSITLMVMCLPGFGLTQPSEWLQATGFRIYASPMEEYLSRCRLVTFVEDGARQQVGECEKIRISSDAWITVIYDTTGQFVWPKARRTQGWTRAMWGLSSPIVFAESEGRGSHIFGSFYAVVICLEEMQGG
jgi:hypothetical protein